VTVTNLGNGAYLATEHGRQHIVYVARTGHERWAFCDGRVYHLRRTSAPVRTPTDSRGDVGPITAPMPGTVRKVLVAAGQHVSRGDTLLILEAMKMELPLRAIDAAVVAAVRCREGDLVQAEAVLVEFSGSQSVSYNST
jgi:acetyl/propionyl-CoA carboxylase alpha subunit